MEEIADGHDRSQELVRAAVPLLRILGFAVTMVAGGNDTTTGLLGGAAELLTERPDQRALLLESPERIGESLRELLRRCPQFSVDASAGRFAGGTYVRR